MKKLLPILFILIITSCSKEVPADQLVERNGIKYEVNSQTPFSGRTVSYYENGQLRFKENFKDGEWEGLSESYYENGQLMFKFIYKNSKSDGLQESYSENGQLESRECFKNGIKVDMSYC